MKKLIYIGTIGAFLFTACSKEVNDNTPSGTDQRLAVLLSEQSPNKSKDYFILPDDGDLASIPQDPKNPLSHAKVELGKFLFHETAIGVKPKFDASRQTFSCASCHHVAAGFQAGRKQGIGDGGIGFGLIGEARRKDPNCPENDVDVQPIRSPSALNSAFQELQLWNGQFGGVGENQNYRNQWTAGTPKEVNNKELHGLETQAIAGLTVHRLDANNQLFETTDYKNLFIQAYGNLNTSELYSLENMGKAIAAYERTLLANQAPFQQWLRGNFSAMTERQKSGAILFFGKANCSSCHTGPALNSMEFYALGMNDFRDSEVLKTVDEATKNGRGGFTGNPNDNYKFKVPQLYNLTESPFYGHGGSFRSVESVIRYKNKGIKENPGVPDSQLAETFKPLGLTEEEIVALTDFIENGLKDPNLERLVPSTLPSGNCFPVADPESRNDLGCNL
ncbi:cytochrome-c peroxidase [Luteibaculum oceani]|uniref:Cytochrome-c peroxidase n=1 Tax=Luteibaculum oceani TaxID=1294296 RepID=A0A5C6V146_9FLAO|nr:cytochrome c peroxidase [Luteibaculum oceani]TXC78610.1 cytochrome-c peroxidase [Luteibaculum oceani]